MESHTIAISASAAATINAASASRSLFGPSRWRHPSGDSPRACSRTRREYAPGWTDRLIEQERNAERGGPEKEAQVWAQTITKCARLRKAYQDQQTAGLMTLEELVSKLKDLDETRLLAENVHSEP